MDADDLEFLLEVSVKPRSRDMNQLVHFIDEFVRKESKNNSRLWVPKIVRELTDDRDVSFISPKVTAFDATNRALCLRQINLTLKVQEHPMQPVLFSCAIMICCDLMIRIKNPADAIKVAVRELVKNYQEWAVGYYLEVPSGCLLVYEFEYLTQI